MLLRLALALAPFLAAPLAAAELPLNADEFDSYTRGRTLYFYSNGTAYGVERYRDDRRVTWSFLDGECKEGRWYQEGRFICFLYEDTLEPQCWTFFVEGAGLRAMFEDDPNATELYEAGESDEPMQCLGPEVGV